MNFTNAANRYESFRFAIAAQEPRGIGQGGAVNEAKLNVVPSRRDEADRARNSSAQLRTMIGKTAPQDRFSRFRHRLEHKPAQRVNDLLLVARYPGQERRNRVRGAR
jgi:hypothetical protein